MNKLFENKYVDAIIDSEPLHWEVMKPNRYGFVYIENPHYLIGGDDRQYIVRKPTPKERREIVINTVIECNGRMFAISTLANKLGVSDRTVQAILRQLQKEGLIEIIPKYDKNGRQKRNAYKYIGPPCEKYGSGLTLGALYSTRQDAGFREFAWREYGFKHDKIWHSIYPLCDEKFAARVARRKYLERNNLPLIVPEDIKYLVLRYCYWKGEGRKLWDDTIYSQDGTIKIALEPLNRIETVKFFGYTFSVEIAGTKDNPKITISKAETKETLGVFTWFDKNIIQSDTDTDDDLTEQFFILGDFTTR